MIPAAELTIGRISEKKRVKPFDEHDAEILAGRVYVHLLKGDDVGVFDLLEIAIERKRQETNETGFEDYRHVNEILLTESKLLPPELANMLEDHEIRTYGQLRRLSHRQIAELPGGGFGVARIEVLGRVLEDIRTRWRKAKKLKDNRRRRKLKQSQERSTAGRQAKSIRRKQKLNSGRTDNEGQQLDLFSQS